MLKQLHRRLTVLSAAITGVVLTAMAIISLIISENQLSKSHLVAFESNINTIVHKIQTDRAVSNLWLAQTEASNRLIIHIEDNLQPLAFRGAWNALTPRKSLVEEVQKKALDLYGFNVDLRPLSGLETPTVVFSMLGEEKERYLCAAVVIPTSRGWQSLTLLRDMREEDRAILRQRLLFALLTVAGIAALFGFSWWFSGRAIRPIVGSQKRQVEFVAAASHELRSPLAVIRSSASAAIEDPERAGYFLGNIERECGRMGRLLEDLLLLAGSDAKTWSIRTSPLDLDTLLIETTELFFPIAAQKKQALSLEFPDDPFPPFCGDYQRLQQALSVLIDNALSYTPEGGNVAVRGSIRRGNPDKVILEVSDTGPGIPPEHRERIFERFYRVNKSRTDKHHFGLGLSIAKELIQMHGGRIYLRDGGAVGATFVIELPLQGEGDSSMI